MFDEPKYWLSLITGAVVTILGGIPLLNDWKIISYQLPAFLTSTMTSILVWLIAAVGVYLLIDSFLSEDDAMLWTYVIVSIIILAIAIIQILFNMKIIGWGLPFITLPVLRVLFVVEGIFLFIAGFSDK